MPDPSLMLGTLTHFTLPETFACLTTGGFTGAGALAALRSEELTLTLALEELEIAQIQQALEELEIGRIQQQTKRPALTALQQQAHQLSVEAGRNSRERKHSCAEARECRRARRQI